MNLRLTALGGLLWAVAPGCSPAPAPERAAPGTRDGTAEEHLYSATDVIFMQDMMIHHAQAIEMSRLAPERTDTRPIRLLARRILETQEFEIGLMQRWLETRGEEAPYLGDPVAAHDMSHMADMAGMATPEQMSRLAGASGADFDRQFLELMIRHHEGAIAMMAELADQPQAGQEPEMYLIVSDIDADQRAEIARMKKLMAELQ